MRDEYVRDAYGEARARGEVGGEEVREAARGRGYYRSEKFTLQDDSRTRKFPIYFPREETPKGAVTSRRDNKQTAREKLRKPENFDIPSPLFVGISFDFVSSLRANIYIYRCLK